MRTVQPRLVTIDKPSAVVDPPKEGYLTTLQAVSYKFVNTMDNKIVLMLFFSPIGYLRAGIWYQSCGYW